MKKSLIYLFIVISVILCGCSQVSDTNVSEDFEIPSYDGNAYEIINDNNPYFEEDEITDEAYETYGNLDSLGRCSQCMACIGEELMPDGERGDISSVHPTGWQTSYYDFVDGKVLYNRCHLIARMLTGEDANERNLITGTRYLNIEGMLPFESMVQSYIKETGNHVMYRVTPIFVEDNLVASGVLMEAKSVEDDGDGILFNVYCFNVQPGVSIDYETGNNWSEETKTESSKSNNNNKEQTYILNTSSKKFHDPQCSGVERMSDSNRKKVKCTREELIQEGYEPCGMCNP